MWWQGVGMEAGSLGSLAAEEDNLGKGNRVRHLPAAVGNRDNQGIRDNRHLQNILKELNIIISKSRKQNFIGQVCGEKLTIPD